MVNRLELYKKVTPCGALAYTDMVELINRSTFTDPNISVVLLDHLSQDGTLIQADWILFINNVKFVTGSTLTAEIVKEWFTGKCSFNQKEFILFLENIDLYNEQPSFLLTENNNFLILG